VAEVVLSRTAYFDLAEIGDYGEAQFGEKAADDYQDAFDRAFERLALFPHIGEARPAFGTDFRCLVCNRHRILYRVSGDTVEIVRVLHHSRDVPRHLPK
jgi:toxin ParE1/3/4